MSVITRTIMILQLLAGSAMPVLGASAERNPPDNLAVWIFLGFCALIIVAQLFPLVIRLGRKTAQLNQEEAAKLESNESSEAR